MQMWFSGDQNQLDDPLKRSVGLAVGGHRGWGEHQPGPAPDDHGPGDHHAPAPAAAADHTAPRSTSPHVLHHGQRCQEEEAGEWLKSN